MDQHTFYKYMQLAKNKKKLKKNPFFFFLVLSDLNSKINIALGDCFADIV